MSALPPIADMAAAATPRGSIAAADWDGALDEHQHKDEKDNYCRAKKQ